jgi:hypothetical protein
MIILVHEVRQCQPKDWWEEHHAKVFACHAKTLAYEPKIQNPTPTPTQQKQTKPGQQSTQSPTKSNANPGKLGTQAKEEFGELERVSRVNALKMLHNMMIMYKVMILPLSLE